MTPPRLWSAVFFAALLPVAGSAQTAAPAGPALLSPPAQPAGGDSSPDPLGPADARFDSNAVVAAVDDKIITFEDLRREIAPRIHGL